MYSSTHPVFKILPLVQVNSDENLINMQKIRETCSKGLNIFCPPEDRALSWLNLLCIYPLNPQHFREICFRMMKSYRNFINHFTNNQTQDLKMSSINCLDEKDYKLLDSIRTDIKRSTSQLLYFINKEGNCCKTQDEKNDLQNHMNRIERILYVFAKVNPEFSYIQGFNELIIPLYYVMHSAKNVFFNNIEIVEAISYYSFEFLLILSDLSSFFKLEHQYIKSKMYQFDKLLKSNIPKTNQILKKLSIDSIQYAYKWFSIMFSQEHPLPQLLPLWDSILAHLDNLSLFEYCIGVARIQTVSESIKSNFSDLKNRLIHPIISKNNAKNKKLCNDLATGKTLSTLGNIKINDIYIIIKNANKIYQTNS